MPSDPKDNGVRFQQCVDEHGNHLGWLKLVETTMTAEEFAKEMEYLANHPYYKSGKYLDDCEDYDGPPHEYRGHVDLSQYRQQ